MQKGKWRFGGGSPGAFTLLASSSFHSGFASKSLCTDSKYRPTSPRLRRSVIAYTPGSVVSGGGAGDSVARSGDSGTSDTGVERGDIVDTVVGSNAAPYRRPRNTLSLRLLSFEKLMGT
jgi:hypothetical protein